MSLKDDPRFNKQILSVLSNLDKLLITATKQLEDMKLRNMEGDK